LRLIIGIGKEREEQKKKTGIRMQRERSEEG
jgi:hypothetical protein